MKKIFAVCLALAMALTSLSGAAFAADWPQFLGDECSQGVSNAQTPTSGAETALRWELNTGSTWNDVPGTPILVGDMVYYYSSQYLRKIDLATGKELAKAKVYGEPVNQFFINIAYGEGKIFVPCQLNNMDDGTGVEGCFLRVYDAETLEQLYVTESLGSGQMQSPVMYHDGYFVTGTYGRSGVYAGFTAEDEDPERNDEVKKISWSVPCGGKYGFSFNGAAFVGEHCYFGYANNLYVVEYKTGETRIFDIGQDHTIHSTIVYSGETGRLYVASSYAPGGSSVISYELDGKGMPKASSAKEWLSHTEGGATQSTPVILNGRLYIGGGGSTMGSAESFHVVDALTMKEIYSLPLLSKGSAAVSTAYATEENGEIAYIYMLPFAPNENDKSELWIIRDSIGQTEADYEVVEGIGKSQYTSQSVLIASDGSLIWYNDAGRLYCYENTAGIFIDTREHWGREYISFLARKGIINGVGGGLFQPDGTVTRAHFVQMLAKMSGYELSGYKTNAYSDVHGTDWYMPAIAWALENGVVNDVGLFRPNDEITRQDMSLMLYRYVNKVAKVRLEKVNTAIDFADEDEIVPEAMEAVSMMQQCGIINGIPSGSSYRFAPLEQATRAQSASLISNFYKQLSGQE